MVRVQKTERLLAVRWVFLCFQTFRQTMTLSLQPLRIATEAAEEGGLLVFNDALLIAVLACLDAPYEVVPPSWTVWRLS